MSKFNFDEIILKSGEKRWECVTDGPSDPTTGRRKQIRRRGKTQKEAKNKVKTVLKSLEEDQIDPNAAKKITFEMAANRWIKLYEATGVKRSTVRIREKEIKSLNRHIGKTKVYKITHISYQNTITALAEEYERNTLLGINSCAGMIFKQLIKDKIIKDNPKNGVVIPKKRRTVEEIESDPIEEEYLDREEIEKFLKATTEKGLDLDIERFYLLAFTGMRSGELCALKWSDINFKTNEIRITKTLYNEDNNMKKYDLTPPKTEGSIRTIEIEQEIMDLLRSHRKRQMKIQSSFKNEIEDFHDANFVFCRPNGYPFIQKNILNRMVRLLRYTDIEKHATPHIFRHSHISMMTEAGVDLATIMERVGHDDMKTTMKIYTHVTRKMKKDASAKVKTLYENALSDIVLK